MDKKIKTSYLSTDEYVSIVEDCRAIKTEGIFNSRVEMIVWHGKMGERISEDKLYKKYNKGNQDFVNTLASDIGISYKEASLSIQFYQKFKLVSPDGERWDKFKEGKNISWNKIKTLYLPEENKRKHICEFEEKKCWICKICGKTLKENPYDQAPNRQ